MNQSEIALPVVLVIDDDQTLHLWAKWHLSAAGFEIVSAINGHEGIDAFKKHSPDIILVDIEMPEMDGFATCSGIRSVPGGSNTPLLMVTGTEDAERIEKSYLAGATDFIVKPVNWQVLIHRLRYMVKASKVFLQLERSESRLSKAQQMARLGHWELNIVDNKLYWSDEIYKIFQQDRGSFTPDQAGFLNLVHASDRLYVEEGFDKVIKNGTALTIEYRIITGTGKQHFVGQQIEIVKNQKNELVALTGTIQDITERKDHENQVRHLAYYDGITGLPNRTCFLEILSTALELAKRNERRFAVLFLDLDGFKGINDSYGHHVGDLLLKEISRRLTEGLRRSDITSRYLTHQYYSADVARLGGDEFTILLNELTQPEDAAIAARNIHQWISEPILLENQKIYSGASIGIALFPQDGEDSETLLKNADVAMYHAKKKGKGNYQFFHDSMNIKAKKRMEMENYMHQAVTNNELRLYYQPVVNAVSSQLIGAEALMRWESPQLGFLYPDDFIPLAEENGMILTFGEWAIHEACRQLKDWQQRDMGHLSIAVNLSSLQFNQISFVPMVKAILNQYQVDPAFLVFELTETVIMADSEKILGTLLELKEMGIKLSIDDFGTGYSSLSYLKRFPLDSIKIDQSFIKELTSNAEDAAIVTAILALARALNLNTIAEGVETAQQKRFLENTTCGAIQGNLFAKPMPMAEFRKYWHSH
ncbi:MAG: EAL domain-containing protein [Methylococcales bacterium]|nr:EAL domain-containing protein [Methylococcales bacterium]